MKKERVAFNSGGETCVGVLTRPKGVSGPLPLVIMAGGWCYVKEMVLPYYAEYFDSIGFATLQFDYRNDGESSGEPRQHLNPWAQIEDYRNALSFAESHDDIDASRTGIWGISYAGGHVLVVSAIDPRPKFAISVVPVIDGFQTMRRVHGEARFAELRRVIMADRRSRFEGNPGGYIPMSSLKPFEEVCSWPMADCFEVFHDIKAREAPNHQHRNTIESVELFTQYDVIPFCKRILDTQVLFTAAKGDRNTSADLQIQAFNEIPNPKKAFEVFDVTHMSIYYDMEDLGKMAQVQADWLRSNFGAQAAASSTSRRVRAPVPAE